MIHPLTRTARRQSFLMRTAALAVWCASALAAQVYFPLAVGNAWLYRASSGQSGNVLYQSVRVHGVETIGDRDYFDVSYFGREVALRLDPSTGDVLFYDRAVGIEKPWVSLGLAVGSTFFANVSPCPSQGQIVSRSASVAVPVGDFTDEVEVQFQGNCPDVGATRQYYAPNVGLVRNEDTTFAGPVIYQLIYYRAGAASSGSKGEVSFTIALDAPFYLTGTPLGMRLSLRNNGPTPVNLHFPSGQSFDFKILNAKGEGVYSWSSDKLFAAIVRDEQLAPGELVYGATAPLQGLPPGHYTVQAYLTTDPLSYSGQLPFDILPPVLF